MIFLCVFVLCGNANKKPFPHFYWKAFLQPLYTKAVFYLPMKMACRCVFLCNLLFVNWFAVEIFVCS